MAKGKQSKYEKKGYKMLIRGSLMIQTNKHLNIRKLAERSDNNSSKTYHLTDKICDYIDLMGPNFECDKAHKYPIFKMNKKKHDI